MDREKVIVRTSILGIAANVLLAGFKAAVGLLAHSVAIVLDAVNNLTDALSSIITIIGTRLAAKAPDKKHPLGHGRAEYLSAAVIAVIILYAGVTALVESVKKIISPQIPDYTPVALIIVAVAVAVKIVLGTYVQRTGQKVNSDSLIASGRDALMDAVISASTLAAAAVYLIWGISLEAWLGAAISLLIIKTGFEMLSETISEILGKRADKELSEAVRASVKSFPEVEGVYDLVIHNYGPSRFLGSVHIALPDVMTVEEADRLERRITEKVEADTGVIMTGISVYSVNTKSDEVAQLRRKVASLVLGHPEVLQIHGFYADEAQKKIVFDVVISFEAADLKQSFLEIRREVQEALPDYEIQMTLDFDISD